MAHKTQQSPTSHLQWRVPVAADAESIDHDGGVLRPVLVRKKGVPQCVVCPLVFWPRSERGTVERRPCMAPAVCERVGPATLDGQLTDFIKTGMGHTTMRMETRAKCRLSAIHVRSLGYRHRLVDPDSVAELQPVVPLHDH